MVTAQAHIVCGGVCSSCHAVLAILQKQMLRCAFIVHVWMYVTGRQRDGEMGLSLYLLRELWDTDLIGCSWAWTSGTGGGSMTGVCL